MTNSDEEAFLREIQHAQLIHRQHYKQECERRFNKMRAATDKQLPCDKSWSDNEIITDSEMRAIDESLRDRPMERKALAESKEATYWRNVWVSCNVLAILLIIFTLFHFA